MIRFMLLALLVLAASALPSQAGCLAARTRLATARVARVATAPVRYVNEHRPHVARRVVTAVRCRGCG
jgi:hypothetical protein